MRRLSQFVTKKQNHCGRRRLIVCKPHCCCYSLYIFAIW